jgi:hypothetical protein
VLRAWVRAAGYEGYEPVDVLTSSYLNLVFHNLLNNEDISTRTGPGTDYFSVWRQSMMYAVTALPWPRLVPTLRGLDSAIFGDYVAQLCAITVDATSHRQLDPHLVEVSVGF